MIEIKSEKEFHAEIVRNELVCFVGSYCSPCHAAKMQLEEFDKQELIDIFTVNVDLLPTIAEKYHVKSLPTVLLFNHGKPVNQLTKSVTKKNLLEFLGL